MNIGRRIRLLSVFKGLCCAMLLLGCSILPKNSPTHYPEIEPGNQYFEEGKWALAKAEFENYLMQFPKDSETKLKLGRTHLAMGNVAEALEVFHELIESSHRFPAETFFWAGRACQMLDQFSDAEMHYREYMEKMEPRYLAKVNYFLQQIGAAKRAGTAETQYLVENAGSNINSSLDELRPIYSPTVDDRFYYSINNPDVSASSPIVVNQNPPMSMAEIRQGLWTNMGPMDPDLAGDQKYQLLEFSKDGQQVLFAGVGGSRDEGIYQKSFEADKMGVSPWIHPIYDPSAGDRDLFMIHDSAYLFASQRLDGFGGYDIFVTYKRLGQWVVQNLGEQVNSEYDEISPFLSNDGRELYFSSNSTQSIGGFDVFFATFNDEMESWSAPQNMLPPLNTGLNEVGFRLSPDGSEALFVSDRPGGYGRLDVYQVHFDQPRTSQTILSNPRNFYHVRAYKSFQTDQNLNREIAEKPVFTLPMIPYGDRPVVITPGIRSELDQVLDYCQLYPHTKLILRVFTDQEVQDQFGLYRPVMVLQKVLDYLQEGGLSGDRYEIRLYGNQYPRYSPQLAPDRRTVLPAPFSNKRLEFDMLNTENLPVRFGVPVLSEEEEGTLSPYQDWQLRTQDLYFRIKLVETDQLIKGKEYYQIDDLMVLVSPQGKRFTYYGGIISDLEEARKVRRSFQAKGFWDARIEAFIGSSILSDGQINSTLIEAYPQLKEYIIYQE